MRIGERDAQGIVRDHEAFKVAGAKDGIEPYRRRQLAAFDAFDAAAKPSPDVRAALRINRAVTALHLKDLDLLRKQVAALRTLDKRENLDRETLQLDVELAVFDRVLAGEWLLEDPCLSPR